MPTIEREKKKKAMPPRISPEFAFVVLNDNFDLFLLPLQLKFILNSSKLKTIYYVDEFSFPHV